MDAVEFFQAIEKGAEYRVPDIDRLIEDEYERENAKIMFGDFVCASGKIHLLTPPGGGGVTQDYNPDQPRDWRGRWTRIASTTFSNSYEGFKQRRFLLSQATEEERASVREELRREAKETRAAYGEGTPEDARTSLLYRNAGGDPDNLAPPQEAINLRAEFRTMTENELDAKFEEMSAVIENGAPPQGFYERYNALSQEIESRKNDRFDADIENLRHMSVEQLRAEYGPLEERYLTAAAQMQNSERYYYRELRSELGRRQAQQVEEWRSEAITQVGREFPDLENISQSELAERIANLPDNRGIDRAPTNPEEALIEARRNMLLRERASRDFLANIETMSSQTIERNLTHPDQRVANAARARMEAITAERERIRAEIEANFEGNKKAIVHTIGGIPKDWSRDDYAAIELDANGYKPADVIEPFMAKSLYSNPEELEQIRHSVRETYDGVKVEIYTPSARIERTFSADSGELVVTHDFFKLDRSHQGKGTSKEIMRNSILAYEKMGVTRIDVHANIDVGGYVWARYGFVPTYDSWKDLRRSISSDFDDISDDGEIWAALRSDNPKAIWALADSPRGKELLAGSDWYGELDMYDSEAVDRFKRYSGAK